MTPHAEHRVGTPRARTDHDVPSVPPRARVRVRHSPARPGAFGVRAQPDASNRISRRRTVISRRRLSARVHEGHGRGPDRGIVAERDHHRVFPPRVSRRGVMGASTYPHQSRERARHIEKSTFHVESLHQPAVQGFHPDVAYHSSGLPLEIAPCPDVIFARACTSEAKTRCSSIINPRRRHAKNGGRLSILTATLLGSKET